MSHIAVENVCGDFVRYRASSEYLSRDTPGSLPTLSEVCKRREDLKMEVEVHSLPAAPLCGLIQFI